MNPPLSLRFALRELRSGVRGFRIFLACLALGVAAIGAAGSTAEAFRQGLAAQAREILGGDLAVGVSPGYPLVGHVELRGAGSLAQAFAPQDGVPGAAVEQALLDRLRLRLGDR